MGAEANLQEVFDKLGISDNYPLDLHHYIEHDKVISLHLNSKGITELPIGIFDKLAHLEKINLFHNHISTFPVNLFDKLKNLKNLHLGENNIETIPEGLLVELNNLELLDLHKNNLTEFPSKSLDMLPKLKYLNLIDAFDDEHMEQMTNLIITSRAEIVAFIGRLKHHDTKEKRRIESLLTRILKIIQQITPDIQVQLTRITELCEGQKDEVEGFLKSITHNNADLGLYLEFEQVFVRKSLDISDELVNQSVSTITSSQFSKVDSFQTCPSCSETQSTLIRECTNCKASLPYCNLCKRGFGVKEMQSSCPQCQNQFHRNHLHAYIQSTGKCPVCKEGLTLSEFESY